MIGRDVIAIAVGDQSAPSLCALAGLLPSGLEAAVIVAADWTSMRLDVMAPSLCGLSGWPVMVAKAGDPVVPGHVYIGPPDRLVLVRPGRIALGPRNAGDRSSRVGETLVASASEAYGPRVIAIALGHGGPVGAEVLRRVRVRGGVTIEERLPDMPPGPTAEARHYRLAVEEMGEVLHEFAGVPAVALEKI
jgi:two-component system chemotaxis response regulator CheB